VERAPALLALFENRSTKVGKIRYLALGAAAALASLAAMSAAQAAVTVTVWGGNLDMGALAGFSQNAAELPTPSTPASAQFVWSGNVDWVNNEANNGSGPGAITGNLFSTFFESTPGSISGFSSPDGAYTQSTLLGASMSDLGDDYFTYILVQGIATTTATVNVDHDDGASLYAAACPGGVCFTSPLETVEIPSGNFTIDAGNLVQLAYIEGNGSPSDLVINNVGDQTLLLTPVPEPSTWAMMLLGFAGLGFAGFRGRRTAISIV
jgi:hypothetical protein